MKSERSTIDQEWKVTWDENQQAQLVDALSASPAQRLAWLEEALEFARKALSARERQSAPQKR